MFATYVSGSPGWSLEAWRTLPPHMSKCSPPVIARFKGHSFPGKVTVRLLGLSPLGCCGYRWQEELLSQGAHGRSQPGFAWCLASHCELLGLLFHLRGGCEHRGHLGSPTLGVIPLLASELMGH